MSRWFIALLAVLAAREEAAAREEGGKEHSASVDPSRAGSEAFVAWLDALQALEPSRADTPGADPQAR